MIADLGWVGFAADIFGPDLQSGLDMDTKVAQATKYRSNDTLFFGRMQAAVDTMMAHPAVDASRVAIIGCKYRRAWRCDLVSCVS
jgi:dienelactone hydrolase